MARSEHCKGKTNEQLEDGDEGYPGIAHDFETMRQQRDELAEALRGMIALVDHLTQYPKANPRRPSRSLAGAV